MATPKIHVYKRTQSNLQRNVKTKTFKNVLLVSIYVILPIVLIVLSEIDMRKLGSSYRNSISQVCPDTRLSANQVTYDDWSSCPTSVRQNKDPNYRSPDSESKYQSQYDRTMRLLNKSTVKN